MAFSIFKSLRHRAPESFSQDSAATTTPISLGVLCIVGAWRHYDTKIHPSPFQEEVWIEWLSWVILFTLQRLFGSPIRPSGSPDVPQLPSFWGSQSAIWLTAAACVGSQLLSSQSLPGPIWVRMPFTRVDFRMLIRLPSR